MVKTKRKDNLLKKLLKLLFSAFLYFPVPFIIAVGLSIAISLYPPFDSKRANDMNAKFYLGTLYNNLNDFEKDKIDRLLIEKDGYAVRDVIEGKKFLSYKGFKVLNTSKWGIDFGYLVSYSDDLRLAIKQNLWQLIILVVISEVLVIVITKWSRYRSCPYQEKLPEIAEFHITLKELLTPEDEVLLYNKLKGPLLSLGDREPREGIKLFVNGRQVSAGFVFILPNCSLSAYANIAKNLDNNAQTNICSTNISFPSKLFGEENVKAAVIQHLKAVNDNSFAKEKKRLQIFRRVEDVRNGIPTFEEFRKELRNGRIKELFNSYFLHQNVTCLSATIGIAPFTEEMFLGDYIVYDGKVVLMYDYETRVLSLLVGRDIENISNIPFGLSGLSDLKSILKDI